MGIPEDLGFSNDQFRNRVGKTFGVMELQPGQVNWGVYNLSLIHISPGTPSTTINGPKPALREETPRI